MKSLLRLKPYLRPFYGLILAAALLAIPLALLRAGPVPLIKYLIDDLLIHRDESKLLFFPLAFIALYAVNFVVRFFHYYFLRIVVARVNQKLKNELYDHLMGLSADYFSAQSTGTLISRVASDPQYVDGGVACVNVVIREPLTFLFLLGYAFHLNWRLTLLTFLVFPPLAWVFSITGKNLRRYMRRMTEENAKIYSTLQESFTGIRIVQVFGLEGFLREKFRERSEGVTGHQLKSAAMEEASHPMVELLTSFVIAAILYFGGSQVLRGQMTSGDLLAFFAAFAMMMNPVRMLNDVNIKLNHAIAACDRIFEIFDWKSRLPVAATPIERTSLEQSISLEQVRFFYPDAPEREVLRGVSFEVKKGATVALVGASGAGKSSLVNLLPRVFDVTAGAIKVDGHDLREFSLSSLRQLIAVVSQDVFLFNDSITENIRCGRLDATDAEILEAARKAHALEFIEKLPDGFATVIGDRGQKLSGGERQRLSIARAFLRHSPILILDEATSSLDSASERAVQRALEELMRGKTTIVIAHRLSTIRHADEIIVLKEGLIVESGRHSELLEKEGEYAHFYRHAGLTATQGVAQG